MTNTADQIACWLAEYGSPTANVASMLCDSHPAEAPAFTFLDADLSAEVVTYGELAQRSKCLATVLAEHGVGCGDRVGVLMGKRRELVVTLLALWRLGAVEVPLFTAFASGAIDTRVHESGTAVVVTEAAQRTKVDAITGLTVLDVDELVVQAQTRVPLSESATIGGDGIIVQLYTSGTTGKPKGVEVPVRALASFRCYLHYSLDVRPEDIYWNAADPGWAYGLYYAVIGPLVTGRPAILLNAGFTPESTIEVIRKLAVTNFAAAPTMYRAMRRHPSGHGLTLRRASSAGEPLTADVVEWSRDALGTEVRDQYGQTELGMAIGNHWNPEIAQPTRPGSMGLPMPGFTAGIVDGQIAVNVAHSPLLWFCGYHENPERTAERFSDDGAWYLTADTGRLEDGYFYFSARNDDVILAAGYRIGPYDIENVLVTHPAVAEVAVVGRPDLDGIRGEVVHAFVVPHPDVEIGPELERELQTFVRDGYSKHAYPRVVHFVDTLPKTPSGKVQRYLLRADRNAGAETDTLP